MERMLDFKVLVWRRCGIMKVLDNESNDRDEKTGRSGYLVTNPPRELTL